MFAEPKAKDDSQLCSSVNYYINRPFCKYFCGGPRDVMIHVAGSSGDPDEDLLQSHPFRQQVDSFTYVLRTGQIDLSQFEINPSKCEWSVAPESVA
ncbi:hypothetical protein NC651_039237 [Populus alba x Populus x berolinensis]|nr:hypothetical protein NC651_039237 [Populus alba x Populus x berolinensis]